jgi:hypothetical protein
VKRTATGIAVLLCLACAATAQGWGVKYANGPDPAVSRWSSWPYPTGCLGVSFDPVTVFSGPTEAEKGPGGPEEALRRYLSEGLYPQVPTRFWRLVAATETTAFFASGRLEQGLFWLAFEQVNGQWALSGELKECRPRTVREGLVALRWDLVPGKGLTGKARLIRVKLSGGEGCDGGRSLNAAADPEFRRVGKRLVLTVWIEPLPPGVYTCEKRIEPPLAVKLPGPLGRRQLWDGSFYPPRRER